MDWHLKGLFVSKTLYFIFVAICILFFVTPAVLAQANYYRLQSIGLVCIKNNALRYLAAPGNQLFIAVSSCPDIPENPLFGSLVNEAPNINYAPDTAVDTFIILTREQLECQTQLPLDISRPVYLYYPEECRLEVEIE